MQPAAELVRLDHIPGFIVNADHGVTVRLRVNPGDSWLVIERKGSDRQYVDIAEGDVEAVLERFQAIKDQTGFADFVLSVTSDALKHPCRIS